MEKQANEAMNTTFMLQFCYTCLKAHECDTEAKCVACWKANGLLPEEERGDEALTTEELLKQYAY